MSSLLKYREKLNLTQEELATKAAVSVRTIQRIEAGAEPKGYTLDALSNALGVEKDNLLNEANQPKTKNNQLNKYINLSSILLIAVPLGNILMPLIIMFWKKEFNSITKQIVSIQIMWSIIYFFLVIATTSLTKSMDLSNKQAAISTMLILIMINLYVILRNTVELERNNKLHINLNFNFL